MSLRAFPSILTRDRTRTLTLLGLGVSALLVLVSCRPRPDESPPPASPQAAVEPRERLEWQRETLIADYLRVGKRSGTWDAAATNLLEIFARERSRQTNAPVPPPPAYHDALDAVRGAGCPDPLVNYIVIRHRFGLPDSPTPEVVEAYRAVAEEMEASGYAPVRKFYATLRASRVLKAQAGTNTPPEVNQLRRRAVGHLRSMARDKETPPDELYEAGRDFMDALFRNNELLERLLTPLESDLFEGRPEHPALLLLRGEYEIRRAWYVRGSGYADTVTTEGWEGFSRHLNVADRSLTRAWELRPEVGRSACKMITVCMGLGKPRAEMEQWFQRAITADPADYDACSAKLYYLEPKWHGSDEEMIEFGRECVRSETWNGRVPLILVDAHESLSKYFREPAAKKAYWLRKGVWPDLQASFEKFFKLYPEASSWRHNYALYAFRCEAWDTLNTQLPLLGEVNYSYFGGREAYEQMVEEAKAHAKP